MICTGIFKEPQINKHDIAKKWQKDCSASTGPTRPYPDVVTYPWQCGATCYFKEHGEGKGMIGKLRVVLGRLAACAHPSKKPKFVSQKGVVFACERAGASLVFARISEAKDAYGRWKRSQMLTLLEPIKSEIEKKSDDDFAPSSPFAGLILRVQRKRYAAPYLETSFRLPINAGHDGCITVEKEDVFCNRFFGSSHIKLHVFAIEQACLESTADSWKVTGVIETILIDVDQDLVAPPVSDSSKHSRDDDDISVPMVDPTSLLATAVGADVPSRKGRSQPRHADPDLDDHADVADVAHAELGEEGALEAALEALLDEEDSGGSTEADKIFKMESIYEKMEDRVAVATESVAPVSTDVAVASQTIEGEPSSSSSESWEVFMARLQIQEMTEPDSNYWQYGSIGGKTPFCRIHQMSCQGKDNLQVDNYKVDCKIHPGCSLWVTRQPQGYEQYRILKEGIEWGASGLSLNKDDHQTAAQVIKESYGMTVKRKRVSDK